MKRYKELPELDSDLPDNDIGSIVIWLVAVAVIVWWLI